MTKIDIITLDSSYDGENSRVYEVQMYTRCEYDGFYAQTRTPMQRLVEQKLQERFPTLNLENNLGPDEIDEADPDALYYWPENAYDISEYKMALLREGRQITGILTDCNPALHLMAENKVFFPALFEDTNGEMGFPKQAAYLNPGPSVTADQIRRDLGSPEIVVFKPAKASTGQGINFVRDGDLEYAAHHLLSFDDHGPDLADQFKGSTVKLDRTYWPPNIGGDFPAFVAQEASLSRPQNFEETGEAYSAARTVWIVIDGKEAIPVAGYLKPAAGSSTTEHLNDRYISSIDEQNCIILDENDPVFKTLAKSAAGIVSASHSLPPYTEWVKDLLKSDDPLKIILGIDALHNPYYPAFGKNDFYLMETDELEGYQPEALPREIEDLLARAIRINDPALKTYIGNMMNSDSPLFQRSAIYQSLQNISRRFPDLQFNHGDQ